MGRKWNNIKEGKAKKDANKSKIYAKFGVEIYVAAKPEPDPEINRNLRSVVEKAKSYGVPRDIIQRAIDKAKGGDEDNYEQLRYEGYGPGGSALIVDCLSDNVNRTVAEVRSAFKKNHGNMGVSGSVSFMFEQVALIGAENITEEEAFELLLEHDCDINDIEEEDNHILIIAHIDQFHKIQEALLSKEGLDEFTVCEISMLPANQLTLEGENLEQFNELIDALEDIDDVQNVYHNIDI